MPDNDAILSCSRNGSTLLQRLEAKLGQSPLTLFGTIQEKLNHVLDVMHDDPEFPTNVKLPEASDLQGGNWKRLRECYDDTVGPRRERIDIFKLKIATIIKNFFEFHPEALGNGKLANGLHRIQAFIVNVRFIAKQVTRCLWGGRSAPTRLGLTPFAAYTPQEFSSKFLASQSVPSADDEPYTPRYHFNRLPGWDQRTSCQATISTDRLPESWDWRNERRRGYSIVTPVKHSNGCSASSLFATVSAMESAFMLSNENQRSDQTLFSEQALLNCMPDNACGTGVKASSLWEQATQRGLPSESVSPAFTGFQGNCQRYRSVARPTSFCQNRLLGSDDEIRRFVYQFGPAILAINGADPKFQFLRGPWGGECSSAGGPAVNHQVLIVGWTQKAFIAKNSWGPDWGVNGYLELKRDNTNRCGIYEQIGVPFFNGQTQGYHT